jgi:hypothetical protein
MVANTRASAHAIAELKNKIITLEAMISGRDI